MAKARYVLCLVLMHTASSLPWAQGSEGGEEAVDGHLRTRTEYGTKPPVTTRINATVELPPIVGTRRPNDLLIGLALMAIPVTIVCAIHALLTCRGRVWKHKAATSPTRSPAPSTPQDPSTTHEFASPIPLRRQQSKSVTWQSPFETKARRSHRNTASQRARGASELHFVMVATPEKSTPSRQQQHTPQRLSRLAARKRTSEASNEPIPQYRLDRLDSSPHSSDQRSDCDRSSSLSLGSSITPKQQELDGSPLAVLHDNGDCDSDSPQASLSSVTADDPEIIRKLEDAMKWTQMTQEFDASLDPLNRPARVKRSSSSLDDFRHDLHHDSGRDEPEQITRSSEYSF